MTFETIFAGLSLVALWAFVLAALVWDPTPRWVPWGVSIAATSNCLAVALLTRQRYRVKSRP